MILHTTKPTLILAIACAALGCAVRQVRSPPSDADRVAALTELTLSADTGSPSTVGVTPLAADVVDSTLTALGYGLADLLITDLARSARLQVVDRTRMDALFRELSLASGERADSVNAPLIGRFVGARRLVSGSLTEGGRQEGSLRLSARILDVQTASIVGRPIDAITDLSYILDAEKELALRILDEMGVTLTPAERAAVEERPTRDIAAFLAYSRGVRDEAAARFEDAAAEYRQAIQSSIPTLPSPGNGYSASARSPHAVARLPEQVGAAELTAVAFTASSMA